jgi:DnaA family protein
VPSRLDGPLLIRTVHQLLLAIQPPQETDFSAYLAGPNAEAVAAVQAWSSGFGEPFLYLFGAAGTGKTHLLNAACRQANGHGKTALCLPMTYPGIDPSVLEDLESADLVALDDVHCIAGDRAWELAVFDLFNRLRAAERGLLVSADVRASELPVQLADLRSRLGWGPGYRLRPLGEDACAELLLKSAQRRGLDLGPELVDYIMRRCPRDAGTLVELVHRLDEKSLSEKRRPSMRLVRELVEPAA